MSNKPLPRRITLQRLNSPDDIRQALLTIERAINELSVDSTGTIVSQPTNTKGPVVIPTTVVSGGGIPGPQGLPGLPGPPGTSFLVPINVAVGEELVVPENRQLLFTVPLEVEGNLIVEGLLIGVD